MLVLAPLQRQVSFVKSVSWRGIGLFTMATCFICYASLVHFPCIVEKQKLARTPFDIARYQSLDFDILTEVVPYLLFDFYSNWNDDGPTEVSDAVGHRRFDA